MPIWKPASAIVFANRAVAFTGHRVKLKVALLSVQLYDPIHKKDTTVSLSQGAIGFLAGPMPGTTAPLLLVAFPNSLADDGMTFERLQRKQDFKVVVVSESTFVHQFEIQVS